MSSGFLLLMKLCGGLRRLTLNWHQQRLSAAQAARARCGSTLDMNSNFLLLLSHARGGEHPVVGWHEQPVSAAQL